MMKSRQAQRVFTLWPPFLFCGIRVRHIAADWTRVDVTHRVGRFIRNNHGAAFGGTLFSMVDPFFALMAFNQLGPGFRAWTESASIDFVAPGRGVLTSAITLAPDEVERIRSAVAADGRSRSSHQAEIHDERPGCGHRESLPDRAFRGAGRL